MYISFSLTGKAISSEELTLMEENLKLIESRRKQLENQREMLMRTGEAGEWLEFQKLFQMIEQMIDNDRAKDTAVNFGKNFDTFYFHCLTSGLKMHFEYYWKVCFGFSFLLERPIYILNLIQWLLF